MSKMGKRRKQRVSKDEVTPPNTEPVETNFNSLPFDCLYHIFDRCPLQFLIPCRRVCSTWNLNLERFCHTKRNLKLVLYLSHTKPSAMEPPRDTELYYAQDMLEYCKDPRCWNDSKEVYLEANLSKLSVDGITSLTRSFQFVDNLTVVLNYQLTKTYNKTRLFYLLRRWSLNLRAFTLVINNTFYRRPFKRSVNCALLIQLHQMISERAVDNFASLRGLHLCYGTFGKHISEDSPIPRLNLPENFLAQLEQLSLDCYTDNQVELLSKLGPSLTHLSLDCRLFPGGGTNEDLIFNLINQLNPALSRTVTHLRLYINDADDLFEFCSFFQAVEYLQLRSNRRVYSKSRDVSWWWRFVETKCWRRFTSSWIEAIACLPNLTTLRLHRFLLDLNPTTLPTVRTLIMHCPSRLFRTADKQDFFEFFKSQFPAITSLSIVTSERFQQSINLFRRARAAQFPKLVNFDHHLIRENDA